MAEVARSQLMAQVEHLAEMGVKKAVVVFLNKELETCITMTDDTTVMESVFLLRHGEYLLLAPAFNDEIEEEE